MGWVQVSVPASLVSGGKVVNWVSGQTHIVEERHGSLSDVCRPS